MKPSKRFSIYGFFIWGLAILFFFYEFFLRVLPATTAKNIIASLDMNIEQFAMIGSAYYLTYSLMQIPVGLLLDRFKAKLLVSAACALCTLGALWFSFAQEFLSAFFARLLIGIGSSFGFVSLIIVILNWFPKKHFATLTGIGQFLGAMGPLCAGGPIAFILKKVDGDWRLVFFWVALFGAFLTTLIILFFKGKPAFSEKIKYIEKTSPLKEQIKALLSSSQVWWTLLYAAAVYVTLPLLGAFWGTAYLETRGLSKTQAAFIISMMWVGFATANPLFGKISDHMKKRKPIITLCAVIGIVSSLGVLLLPITNEYYLGAAFFLIGLAGSGQNVSFAIMSENAPKFVRATALALNNTAITAFATFIPPLVTLIIRGVSKTEPITELAFKKGLLAAPVCFAIAFLISRFFLIETYCRDQRTVHHIY